jgi:DNA-binding transcriptional ArsR family regulator
LTFPVAGIIFNRMVKHRSDDLDLLFHALSDPTRRAIIEALAHGKASVTELAEPYEMSLPAVSKHLKILETAGIVVREREGRVHRLTLDGKQMKAALAWIERYRRFWMPRFDALDALLTSSRK